ncbi:aminodeoxychorismate synthase component I [Sphingorhabdus arenilitoris]|uniref:Probable branched-chain-amino-acid aminotransferase n=1 Tax=Sphingorhabdus arenilitoris TaxID=1490041 RepID=A0ABV8RDA1_9SPHN
MITPDAPFLFFDDARRDNAAPSRLYQRPDQILTATGPSQLPELFSSLRQARLDGYHAAGYLGYEAGYALQHASFAAVADQNAPLAWFGLFKDYQIVDRTAVASYLPNPAGAYLSAVQLEITASEYHAAFAKVQEYIRAGDIYQANLTFRAAARYAGSPLALYAAIRANAAAGYGAAVWTGKEWILSFSPELFFSCRQGQVTARPMKGTASRCADPDRDKAAAEKLRSDPKQRAENLMIVDLLRNDLSRICVPGSVEVPDLFRVESYPTVHQMTSTVTGSLEKGRDAVDLIEAIFPCGSITGAPKIRAMEIISEIEHSARGIYCGSIGRIDQDGDAAFNVAIRTFSLDEEAKQISFGLGSGVVADSVAGDEWAECLAKGEFAKMAGYGFDLIETMRFEPADGLIRLELHLERMKESARALGFEFDRHAARNQLHAVTFHLESPSKVRLLLSRAGSIAIEVRPLPQPPSSDWQVAITRLPVARDDFRLCHKCSDRAFYDDARKQYAPADEVLFTDADGYLTEGSFTSIFLARDGKLLTPPVARGLLPSILRRELIENGEAIEADLRPADLEDGFFVGNSLRGLISARIHRS